MNNQPLIDANGGKNNYDVNGDLERSSLSMSQISMNKSGVINIESVKDLPYNYLIPYDQQSY